MKNVFLHLLFCLSINSFSQIPTDGMVGRWTFSGNALEDSGTNNDGNVIGAQLTEDRCGNPNSAYTFDGDDLIECSTDNMGISNSISISCWFKTTTSGYDVMVSKYSWPEDVGYNAQFDITGCPEIRGRDGNGDFSESNTNGVSMVNDKWHHFVGIVDNSTWTTYIDTIMIASIDNGHNIVDIGTCSFPLTFGRLSEESLLSWRFYIGDLDDITIYNRPVDELDISKLFHDNCTLTSIEEETLDNIISVFPNPSTGLINIKINSEIKKDLDISIIDIFGRELSFESKYSTKNQIIDISKHSDGIYLLNIKINNQVFTQRIILQ